ncbi:cation-translocating P-type ATPase [Metabacillus sediminilitoris]|uniref:P-type Ca(2+) transporter n=1 Tax=Metabacillus sediminilitoris TaxID=2567941 RepID=A0A4S4BX37_9BACI|nr:HAD-IC family P-type ATPase [Metabacillus sediminilitoris]QGQ46163.1 HAD-IC family P-type ATPase [Metabacillus sediminilitoris]THF79216.1 cation-transporting P-type ATPase [Metabacillus sediminilitoris]
MILEMKKRYYHITSGRVRMELYGIYENPERAEKFIEIFSTIEGVTSVKTSISRGCILLNYNEELISIDYLLPLLMKFEEVAWKLDNKHKEGISFETDPDVEAQVAATSEMANVLPFTSNMPKQQVPKDNVPLPLTLSVVGLGALGLKQLFLGRSALARHPVLFYMSSAFAVATGYPFFRRGIQQMQNRKGALVDFVLGASSLALALVRENLVVLAGLSLLQYLNWKRRDEVRNNWLDEPTVSPEIHRYTKRAGALGIIASLATLAITRNPLVALGILLTANPRPAIVSAEYSWSQAEMMAQEAGLVSPHNGSMYQLSQINTVLLEEDNLLYEKNGTMNKNVSSFIESLPKGSNIAVSHGMLNKSIEGIFPHINVLSLEEVKHKAPQEVLVIQGDKSPKEQKLIYYYPSIDVRKLNDLSESLKISHQIKLMIKKHVHTTRAWNLIGPAIALTSFVSAPLLALIADSLILSFLVHGKHKSEKLMLKKKTHELNKELHPEIPWHAYTSEEIYDRFQSSPLSGLDDKSIKKWAKSYGKNKLQAKQAEHWFKSYISQFKEFAMAILGITALISIFTGHMFDGIAMGTILLLNAGIGTFQERKAKQAVQTMTKFVPPNCKVIRNGETFEVSAEELVPGDIVELESGERVPADLRIIQTWNLEVDESTLTGESLPVQKSIRPIDEKVPITDRANMLYMGTHVTRGKGKAVVVQTGNQTEIGRLFMMLADHEEKETPLQKQVTQISKAFMKGALVIGGIVFIAGLIRGIPLTSMMTTSLALTASAIPEGLPVTITIALTAGILRMAKKDSLTRKMSALETLGRVNVICSDKTGTLTKNEMTVKKIATLKHEYDVTGDGYCPDGEIQISEDNSNQDLEHLLRIGVLCNNSSIEQENGHWIVKGDPTEGALLTVAKKYPALVESLSEWEREYELPFDSDRGMMTVACRQTPEHKDCYVLTKGSVEKIIACCKNVQVNGKKIQLTNSMRESVLQQAEKYADDSLRVLGFAIRKLRKDEECNDDMENDLTYIGMVGMIDPPKEEVKDSIQEAKSLGITPIMITGDHPITALSIAKQIGIGYSYDQVLTGEALNQLSDSEFENIIDDIRIYARVTPNHKLRIVTSLQNKGYIVAMTGDGVNDSLAIKKADVGIAMGRSGTQLTKETSDIVLKEDHFGSIVDGVKEGRTIIGNIRKALGCLLCGNLAEIIVTSTAVIAGLPLPIVPIQILLMNLITDALPAMVLAVNPGNKTKERKRQEIADKELYQQVITRGLLLGLGSLGLFVASLSMGTSIAVAQTTAFAALVTGQLIQTFSWRQEGQTESVKDWTKDRFLIGALGVSALALLSSIYIPGLSTVFKTSAIPMTNWLPIIFVAGVSAFLGKAVIKVIQAPKKLLQKEQLAMAA